MHGWQSQICGYYYLPIWPAEIVHLTFRALFSPVKIKKKCFEMTEKPLVSHVLYGAELFLTKSRLSLHTGYLSSGCTIGRINVYSSDKDE